MRKGKHMIGERQKTILEQLVKHYVRTARPVASRDLLDRLPIKVSPATVRNDMQKLDEMGYLEQPHTSAGRVPTDRGYRFFIDHILEDMIIRAPLRRMIENVFEMADDEFFIRELGKTIARMTRSFTVVGWEDDPVVSEAGFSEIFEEPEFENTARVKMFGTLVDMLGDQMRTIIDAHAGSNHKQIFIGKENPFPEAQDYTMMISPWQHPRGFRGYVTIIGPTRMNYSRNISILKYIHRDD